MSDNPNLNEDTDTSSVDDIGVLEKIFDNFASDDSDDNDDIEQVDDEDIETLIKKGNKYSEEIRDNENKEDNSAKGYYDEKGNYIPSSEEMSQNEEDFKHDFDVDALLGQKEKSVGDSTDTADTAKENQSDDAKNVNEIIDNTSDEDLLNLLDDLASGNYSEEYKSNDNSGSKDYVKDESTDEIEQSKEQSKEQSEQHPDTESFSNSQTQVTEDDIDALLASIDDAQNFNESSLDDEIMNEEDDDEDDISKDNDEKDVQNQPLNKEVTPQDKSVDSKYENDTSNTSYAEPSINDSVVTASENSDDAYSTADGTVFLPKEKKSLFKRLFGNVDDKRTSQELEELAKKEEQKRLKKEAKKEEKKKKKQVLDEEGNPIPPDVLKEQKKKEKQEKKNEIKKKKALEKEKKKKFQEEELKNQPATKINKVGATIVFIFFICVCLAIVILMNKFSYSNTISSCEKYYKQGQYAIAYDKVNKVDLREDDKYLYDELRTIMYVQEYIDDEVNFMKIKSYDKALNSLLTAYEQYDKKNDEAKKYNVEKAYKEMYTSIIEKLQDEFGVNESQAKKILSAKDNDTYSQMIHSYTKQMYAKDTDKE